MTHGQSLTQEKAMSQEKITSLSPCQEMAIFNVLLVFRVKTPHQKMTVAIRRMADRKTGKWEYSNHRRVAMGRQSFSREKRFSILWHIRYSPLAVMDCLLGAAPGWDAR